MNILRWSLGLSLCLLGFFFFFPTAQAKNLYVNPSGCSDSTTWANNDSNNPWCTIGRAAWGSTNRSSPNSSQAAQAGDVVLVAAGTYSTSVSGGQRYDPLFNPANSGTAGNPIVFRADGLVAIQSPVWSGPAIGTLNRSYITWDGFYLNEWDINTRGDTGPAVIWSSQHVHLLNLRIIGHNLFGGNHAGIYIAYSDNGVVRNSTISDISAPGGAGQNEAGVMLYDSNDTLIENNEIYNTGTGVYIKGVHPGFTQERTTVRYNLLRNLAHAGVIVASSVNSRVYQNVIRTTAAYAFDIWTIGTHSGNMIINNTSYDIQSQDGWTVLLRGEEHDSTIQNNIFYTNLSAAIIGTWAATPTTPESIVMEHNNYYNFASNKFTTLGSDKTFDVWKSTWGRDLVSPASILSDPAFVNAGDNNFRLHAESPARSLGVDILNFAGGGTSAIIPAGAYITGSEVIGISTSSTPPSDTTPPAAPTGLSII